MVEIRLQHLQLRRPGGFALGPISLQLPAGQRTALVGPSGCGKTTLLRLIAGLEGADAGEVWLGQELATDGRRLRVSPAARGIGFVFQDGALWPHLDAAGHLRFCAPGLSDAEVAAALARVGLAGRQRSRPRQLSGGEQQRLALARALAGRPRLLLLDEPLHSVDVHLRDELALLIRSLAEQQQLTLVVVTHDRDEALAIADDLVVLSAGQLVEQGPAARLLTEPGTAFTAAFLADAVCLPAPSDGNGSVRTPFGPLSAPPGRGPWHLALLPGDVRVDPAGPARGRLLQILPRAGVPLARVELQGRSLLVTIRGAAPAGGEVGLSLARPGRLLPGGPVTESNDP